MYAQSEEEIKNVVVMTENFIAHFSQQVERLAQRQLISEAVIGVYNKNLEVMKQALLTFKEDHNFQQLRITLANHSCTTYTNPQ
jgi:hypothetical protein